MCDQVSRPFQHTLTHHALGSPPLAFTLQEEKKFTFDGVKDEGTTQEEVFSRVGRIVLDNCMIGYNGTIFAYGQTGSGKTYTMTGLLDDQQNIIAEKRGLMPRCFEHLFGLIGREVHKVIPRLRLFVNVSTSASMQMPYTCLALVFMGPFILFTHTSDNSSMQTPAPLSRFHDVATIRAP